VGTGPGEVSAAAAGSDGVVAARNQNNYRLSDADELGKGGPKQKFRQNVAAIVALRKIEAEGRSATDDEKAILAKYTGWGGLPQVFATPKEAPKWQAEQAELKELLSHDDYTSAQATVLNAHFTAPVVVSAMYAAVSRLGFTHGRVLEPACGLGHFFGLMPKDMAAKSELTGIEVDGVTARLAQALYPDADIRIKPFEKAVLATNSFDIAISNVPFGDYAPFDSRLNPRKFLIHDYFLVAAAEVVRPGGLIAFITSRGTLDKQYPILREAVAQKCEFVGAIRLPHTAFKQIANTEVTTDILFLRTRAPGERKAGVAWRESKPFGEKEIFLNEYFHGKPEMMLGRLERVEHGMYGRDEVRLADDGRDLAAALATAVTTLPMGVYQPLSESAQRAMRQSIPAPPGVKPNAYVLTAEGGGTIARREGDELRLLAELPVSLAQRLRRLIQVRDAARECLRTQVEERSDVEIEGARFRLNQDYDYFAGKFGPVSSPANVRAFAGDPDAPLLLSLEIYDEDRDTAAKTAIFRERTIQRRQPVQHASGAKEALVVTLSERGRVDLDHIAKLLGRPAEQFLPELAGVLFQNPATQAWETDDEYLSGNVREKLTLAETAAKADPRYTINAEALGAVQPIDLKASEIDARLGSVWIPAEDVADFAREILRAPAAGDAQVSHAAELALWTVEVSHEVKTSVANRNEWGTERVPAHELIEQALNLRTPTVFDYDDKGAARINATATEGAREKQQKLRDRFTEWLWQSDGRRERLVAFYNREFNNVRLRAFNGDHLQLPGASPAIVLRSHQKAGVWRILQTPNTLLAHTVGGGKTFAMAAAAMELKRLGLARKPMFVVPNHMLGQFSSELLLLYPGASVLAAGKDDFASAGRRELISRIATNNWDAVIVTHSGFERLPISTAAKKEFFQTQLEELESCIREVKGSGGSRIVKEIERAKKRLEFKLESLAAEHRKDNTLTFEELGVDRLFVDEAQAFKNLFYTTKMTRVAGLPQTASERAFDMLLKVRHVQSVNGGGGVTFATGTPITNTMAEMFTMQRYLQPEVLQKLRLKHFDAWAATFGETVTAMELAPDGAGYRLNTRFARFVNVPELMHLFRQMADVQTAAMLKLPVPALDGGKARVVQAPCSPELKEIVAALAKRAEKLKTDHVPPWEDNMLKITGEGRKAALDLRLVRPGAPDHADSKVNTAVREIFSVWQETRAKKLSQMVFCDLSTPKVEGQGFSVYQDVKAKLVRLGVPAEEIAFIQDYDSDASKLALFRDVRSGKVRVLMGSTQKMGAGTNAQTLLVAEHHLDAPWRPADIEQREGRILRQGNTNPVVKILRYVTEGSFDAYMWQTLETKAKFISQIMTGESTARRIEDLDTPALTYAEVKAIASGNPLVIEKAKVDAEVMRLSRLRAEHNEAQYTARARVRMAEQDAARFERWTGEINKDLAARQDTHGEKFRMVVNGEAFTDRPKAGAALIYAVEDHKRDHLLGRPSSAVLGELAGFKVEFRSTNPEKITLRGAMEYAANVTPSPVGIVASLEHAARSIEEDLARCRQGLERAKKEQVEFGALTEKVFDHEERYRELAVRQSELVKALDITKNQASERLATESQETETSDKEEPAEHEAPEEQPMPAKRPREEAAQTPRKAEFAVEKEKVAAPKTKPPELKTPAEMLGPNGHRVDASAANWDGEGFFRVKMKGKPTSKQVVREWKDYHSIPQKARDEFAFGLSNDGVPLVFHRLRTIDGALRFNWSPVGEHGGGGMGLSASHRGKGIGREFVRWMMEHGHWTGTALGYSPAGKATVLSAHRAIVAQAMAENRPVSAAAVDAYKLAVPKGYLREGEAYRFVRVKGLDAGPKPANDVTAPVRRVKLRVA
jgi:N12 class adenine-specific DNA methylase/adenine-specific DNA methylase